MSPNQDARAVGILTVGELAITRFEAAGDDPPSVVSELRVAIDRAKSDPASPDKVEHVREILMSVPELEALLREKFPQGARPRPFSNINISNIR